MKWLFRILAVLLLAVLALAVGGWFALKRPDIPFETLEARYGGTDSRYINLPSGLRVRYIEHGDAKAPAIVLVHGYTASLDTWRPWMKDLAGYRVIAIDLPGHGLTRAPETWQASPAAYAAVIEQVAAALKLDRFVLVGQSMGGYAAWEYALAYPQRLTGLVLVDAAGWPDERPEVREQRQSAMSRALANPAGRAVLKDLDSEAVLRRGLLTAFEKDALVTDAMVERYVDMGRAPGHRDITLGALAEWDRWAKATPQRLSGLRTPTLIMHGELDQLVPLDHARKFDAAIPDSRLIVYRGLGHMVNEEAPEATVADLKAFMGTLRLGAEAEEQSAPARPAEPQLPPASGPTDPSLIFH